MEQSTSSAVTDFAQATPMHFPPHPQSSGKGRSAPSHEDFGASPQGSLVVDGEERRANLDRSVSTMSQSNTLTPSRGGTLKKKQSLRRAGSINRRNSRKSLGPGSASGLEQGDREKHADAQDDETYSAFYTPVPTTGSPTDILADRFQAWRKVLKDLILYYRDIQKSYEARSKSLISISNILSTTGGPGEFLSEGGIGEALQILKQYHKQSLAESNKAKNIEEDVIMQLSALRSDLQQKIKEIKNLSGDFKNSVDREIENTRKAVCALQESLVMVDRDPSVTSGKGDPFIVRLGVERQIEKQIDEENYLHRAFLNLENSGRELESIVVGEIQKAHNAYAGILRREADEAYEAVEQLKSGPITMKKDLEWKAFVDGNKHFVDPRLPIRKVERIHYPGKDAPAAAEVRSGMLERKSKYLKSYTPGWYVLSPTHLHEFKSPDRITFQSPVMSLYLPDQKLGSRSNIDSSSHKFMLKGRQTGGLHRGHGWVFRAESRDTMLAWYEDIRNLTEKTREERDAFVRRHVRSTSGGSHRALSVSSDGAMEEDEADKVPYSGKSSHFDHASPQQAKLLERPQPGGRFPSDLNVNGGLRVSLSPFSGASSDDQDIVVTTDLSPPAKSRAEQHLEQAQYDDHHENSVDVINSPIVTNSNELHAAASNRIITPADSSLTQKNHYSLQNVKETEHKGYEKKVPRQVADEIGLASVETPNRHETSSRLASRQVPSEEIVLSSVSMPQNMDPNGDEECKYVPVPRRQKRHDLPALEARGEITEPSASPVDPIQTESYTPETQRQSYNGLPVLDGPYHYTQRATASPIHEIISTTSGSHASATNNPGADNFIQRFECAGIIPDDTDSESQPTEKQRLLSNQTKSPKNSNPYGDSTSGMTSLVVPRIDPAGFNDLQEPQSDQSGQAFNDLRSHPHEQATSQELSPTNPSLGETAEQNPASATIELGEFGSTPKLDDTRTFDSILSNATLKSAELGYDNDSILPSRPKVVSQPSVNTISNLHVPGEFPRTPGP